MKSLPRKRFALASVTALFGSVAVAACSGSSAFIDDAVDSGSSVTQSPPGPSPTVTTTSTGTSTVEPPPPIDASYDAYLPPVDQDAGPDASRPPPDASLPDAAPPDASGSSTCLDPTPIDQTQFRYVRAAAPVKGACSNRELNTLVAYYKEHAGDDDFSVAEWRSSVDDACGACAFTNETNGAAKSWRSLITADDELQQVNRGGCVESVSGSFTCGRAYQQFLDCTIAACTAICKDFTGFSECRNDPRLLTTACKDAYDAVQTECGAKVGTYEQACKGTTYTFEGPIRISCITGFTRDGGLTAADAGTIKDSGDAADAP